MKKIVTMLTLVWGFTMMAMAQIRIPWTMWELDKKDPCENGQFAPDGRYTFIDGEPAVSGTCVCYPGYWGPLCQFTVKDN